MKPLIPAVAYYRMSSDAQDHSIGDQRKAVEEYAAQYGYKILREYRDHGISGWKCKERVGFQQLISNATDRGDFDAVLCFDQDRFSRFDPLEANHYWYLLSQANVHLATVAQGRIDWHSLAGWLTASVAQHGKAQFCRDLARNVTRGLRRRKLAGDWIGGVPFGYRLEGARLVLGDDAAIVRRIFDLRAKGSGFFSIAQQLNAEGIPSPKGKTWSSQGIRHIVTRKAYVGDSIIGEYARGKYEHIATEQSTIANTHPAVVDNSTWKAAQPTPEIKRPASDRKGVDGAALAGLLRCGRCGGPMYSRTNRGCESYLCGNYSHRGKCGCCQVPRAALLSAVAKKIREVVLMGSQDRLEAAIERQLERRKAPNADDSGTRRRIATVDRQIERAAGRMLAVDDSLVGDLETQLLKLKAQRTALVDSLEVKATAPRQSAKSIAAKLWELDRILATAPATTVRHTLAQLIDYIRLDFREVAPTRRGRRYEFTGGVVRLRSEEVRRLGMSWR